MENKIYPFFFILINQLFITIHKVFVLLNIHETLNINYKKNHKHKKLINIHSNFMKKL